jgi:type IV pilus assembly protein PilM
VLKIIAGKSRALLGLDISSTAVKLLEMSSHGRSWRLDNYVVRALPENAVQEKNLQDPSAVAESIRQAISLMNPVSKEVAVAVAGSAVITKVIEMPAALTDSEMENQIVVEADQYIPYPLSEVAIDFERQDDPDVETGMNSVLLAACRRENVDSRVNAVEEAGLKVNVVDIEAFAMERACGLLLDQYEVAPSMMAVVDIGSTATTLHVLREGKTIYTREQLFGGKQLQEAVQFQFSLSPQEADIGIRKGTLPPEYESTVLHDFRESVADQVNRALQFFFSSSHYNTVDLLVLAGGVAVLPGLAERMEEETGIRTDIANPFRDMQINEKINRSLLTSDAPALMIACGLAMRKRY